MEVVDRTCNFGSTECVGVVDASTRPVVGVNSAGSANDAGVIGYRRKSRSSNRGRTGCGHRRRRAMSRAGVVTLLLCRWCNLQSSRRRR